MSMVDTGTYGAKRQSWKKASPRDALKRLMDEHSRASEAKLHTMFVDLVRDDPDLMDAIIEYWFANNYRSLVHKSDPIKAIAAMAQRTKRAEATKERVNATKQTIKVRSMRMVLLDLTMPSGKTLRSSTGKDCDKAGGWFKSLAAAIKPTDKVGDVLSETQVRKFFQQA